MMLNTHQRLGDETIDTQNITNSTINPTMGATNRSNPMQNRSFRNNTYGTNLDAIIHSASQGFDQDTSGYGNEEWRQTNNPPNNFSSGDNNTSDQLSHANLYDQIAGPTPVFDAEQYNQSKLLHSQEKWMYFKNQ